jgi:hypothetical protein
VSRAIKYHNPTSRAHESPPCDDSSSPRANLKSSLARPSAEVDERSPSPRHDALQCPAAGALFHPGQADVARVLVVHGVRGDHHSL